MRWRRGKKLGFGTFGVVWACCRSDDGAPDEGEFVYAIKYLQADYAALPEAVARFKREVKILRELDHPNVMSVVSNGSTKDVPWFVMPRANGLSLKEAIDDGRAEDEAVAVGIMRDVLAGMSHAHECGVLHRDIKPSNILLHDGVPLVSDFGIAKQVDVDGTTLTLTAQDLGTFRYMAPEQSADAKRAGKPADVYALGKVFGHMLSGILPEPLVMDLTGIPEKFKWFIDKCTRSAPGERFPDATVALAKFEQILDRPEVELPPHDQAVQLAENAFAALGTPSESDALEAFDAHLQRHDDQRAMYQSVLPTVPWSVWERWSETQPLSFAAVIANYCEQVDCGLDFDYCDTACRFLVGVWKRTNDLAVRRLVLARAMDIGRYHDRYNVRDQLVDLLASLSTASEVSVAEEVIEANPGDAAWVARTALTRPLRAPLAAALRAAKSREDQAIGF